MVAQRPDKAEATGSNPVFSILCLIDSVVIPKYAYRTNLMYGWTGRESVFADAVIKEWDAIEAKQNI